MRKQVSTNINSTKKPVKKVLTHDDDEYELFLSQIKSRFINIVKRNQYLFDTEKADLFAIFLKNLPLRVRQHYNCNACRHFVNKFGGVVAIADNGKTIPLMWNLDDVPELYKKSVDAIYDFVSASKITNVFVSNEKVWGHPVTGIWHHMAVTPPKSLVFYNPLLSSDQYSAEKTEDYKTLLNGLHEFPLAVVEQALTLLKTESLYRSEKILGVAEWLKDLHVKRSSAKNNTAKTNFTWLAVASAPAGFCHIKSTMIGTLLEDLKSKIPYREVKRKFEEKMNPTQYQRPQAAPTQGNIKTAEKVISKLEAEGSLERRFATIDEIQTVWRPNIRKHIRSIGAKSKTKGVFSHLESKDSVDKSHQRAMTLPSKTITWEKFRKTILPEANKIEFHVPFTGNFTALVTAARKTAPPIIAWDLEEKRNPVSWYVYYGGSAARQWQLQSDIYCDVTGICLQPSGWNGGFSQHGESVTFILDGAKDTQNRSLGLFPEILKSDFHAIRSTIEAYSHSRKLKGLQEASACGIRLQKDLQWNYKIRVTADDYVTEITLDRWD